MIAYVESSAVLAWLLGEPAGTRVRQQLRKVERVVTSTLTSLECHRALERGRTTGRLIPAQAHGALQLLETASTTWTTLEMTGVVLRRARESFPHEPVRTLDALHLATALHFQSAMPDLVVVSLDDRVRENAEALGMGVSPR